MSEVKITDREEEESQITYAPAVVGLGMLLATIAITLWPPAALLALVVTLVGIALWTRESVKQRPVLRAPDAAPKEEMADRWRRPSAYWWAAFGFGFLQVVTLVAGLRTLQAHGGLDPRLPDVPVHDGIGLAILLAALAAAAVAVWAAREATREHGNRIVLSLAATGGAGLLVFALAVAQVAWWVDDGLSFASAQGSAAYWTFGAQALFTLGSVLAIAIAVGRAAARQIPAEPWGAAHAVLTYWWITALSWVILYAALYVKLIRISAHLI